MNLFYSMTEKLFFYARHSICEEGVDLTMKKVSLRIEDEILEILKILCGTDNVSEAVRIAILFYLQNMVISQICIKLSEISHLHLFMK